MRISVIVPVLDDRSAALGLLDAMRRWTRAPDETLIVDAGRDAGLAQDCAARGARYLQCAPVRGAQLDTGARAARGDVLWFLHADAEPDQRALQSIVEACGAGRESGCFRFRFQGRSTAMKALIEQLVRLRIACGGTPYGDQGLFVTRQAYDAVGGFRPLPLFEEVELVRQLRGRGSFARLAVPVGVATHRWERDGYLRRSLHNRWLAMRHLLGADAVRLDRAYRQGPAAGPANGHGARPGDEPDAGSRESPSGGARR